MTAKRENKKKIIPAEKAVVEMSETESNRLFAEKYSNITELKIRLRNKIESFSGNDLSSILPLYRELLLIEHGNNDLLKQYEDALQKCGYLEESNVISSLLQETKSVDSDSTEDIQRLNEYQEIIDLIDDNKLFSAQDLVLKKLVEYPFDQYFVYLQSKIFYHKGERLKAKVLLEDILTTHSDFHAARNDLAIICHELGSDDKAIECLKFAIGNNNYNFDILRNLGDLYLSLEMFEEAISIFKLAINDYPAEISTYRTMARLSSDAGLFDDAKLYIQKALEYDPRSKELLEELNQIEREKKSTKMGSGFVSSDLVSIIIVTYNNLHYTRETIRSIKRYSDYPYEIIVVDNGSTDGSKEYLANNPNVLLISNDDNKGFAYACNQGLRAAAGKFLLILNNDVIVTKNWLTRMLGYFNENADMGIVGPISNHISGPQMDFNFIDVYNKLTESGRDLYSIINDYSEAVYNKNKGKVLYFPRITGFCMLIKRELIDTIGGFDISFGIGNYEDDDFCARAMLAGYKAAIAPDVFIYHYGSKSFDLLGKEKYQELLDGNKKLFYEKYGKYPEDIFLKQEEIKKEIKIKEELIEIDSTLRKSGKNSLALCMIVKNEEENISNCINSVLDIVSEIVVVDTGSQDKTVGIASSFGAKVINSEWKSDFSYSRNIALENVKSDWIIFLDADEQVEEESIVELLTSINREGIDGLSVEIKNIQEEGAFSEYDIFRLTRIFRNRKEFRYEGIIHEQIKPSMERAQAVIVESGINILHYGYHSIDENKIERNAELLRKAIEKDPMNPYLNYQLGSTLFAKTDNAESLKYFLNAVECNTRMDVLPENIKEKIFIKISQYYLQRDLFFEAKKYNEIALKINRNNPISIYISAAILFMEKRYNESLTVLKRLIDLLLKENKLKIDLHQIYVDLGNNYYILEDYDNAFITFQKALEIKNDSYVACFNLGNLLLTIGHKEDALTMFEWAYKINPKLNKAKEMIDNIKAGLKEKQDGKR